MASLQIYKCDVCGTERKCDTYPHDWWSIVATLGYRTIYKTRPTGTTQGMFDVCANCFTWTKLNIGMDKA